MFQKNKYTRWYQTIINRAKQQTRHRQDGNYYESHHTIPKCMGGTEEVLLTAKEHFICHLLLCRMTTGSDKHKMINALIKMAFSKSDGQHRYTARSFSLVRKFIAEKNSEMFKGKPKSDQTRNNMKGRSGKWIRTEDDRDRMRGENNPMFGKFGELNPMNNPEARRKVSNSKIGRKRIYRQDGSHYYERKTDALA